MNQIKQGEILMSEFRSKRLKSELNSINSMYPQK